MVEQKGAECVHEAQLVWLTEFTVFDAGCELLLGDLVLPLVLCFSQSTSKWINAQVLFYSDPK